MTPIRFLTLALTVLAVTSCEGGPFVNPVQPAGPVWEEPQLSMLLQAYRQRLPGKTRVLELYLRDSSDTLRVHDPKAEESVSEYHYFNRSGVQLGDPSPGHLEHGESFAESPFFLDQVASHRIPGLVRTVKEKMSFEGAKIHSVRVKRGPPPARDVQIEIIVNGKYNSGRLLADSQGNVLKVEIL
ncbi:MAG TPA: hypothetical protein VLB76_11365 [Thermoanaerobaculia bacterium]|jgi:hypothetical protein|nr:hypothetical protein [Thermoanaerobaculia bacterium]